MAAISKREGRNHSRLQTTEEIQKNTFYPLSLNFWVFLPAEEMRTTSRLSKRVCQVHHSHHHASFWSGALVLQAWTRPCRVISQKKTFLPQSSKSTAGKGSSGNTHTRSLENLQAANEVTIKENRWRFIDGLLAVFSKFPDKGKGLVITSLLAETAVFPPSKWLDDQTRMIAFWVLTHQRAAAFQMWCQPLKTQDVPLALPIRPSLFLLYPDVSNPILHARLAN